MLFLVGAFEHQLPRERKPNAMMMDTRHKRNKKISSIPLVPLLQYPSQGYLYTLVGFLGTQMPLQLLQIRRIFPTAQGMFANWSFCPPRSALARGDPTSHECDVTPSTDTVGPWKPVGHKRRIVPPMEKPVKELTSKRLTPIRPSEWPCIAPGSTVSPFSLWRKGVTQNGCCFAWTRCGLARPPFALVRRGPEYTHFALAK